MTKEKVAKLCRTCTLKCKQPFEVVSCPLYTPIKKKKGGK